jgi:hypothetical protein
MLSEAPSEGAMRWITLAECLDLIGGDKAEQLRAALLAGDVKSRKRNPDGTIKNLRPVQWRTEAKIDWQASLLDVAVSESPIMVSLTTGRRTSPPPEARMVQVEIDLETLLDHFPSQAKPRQHVGGRRSVIPPEALIEVGAWLGAVGIPDKLVEVEDKLREAIAAAGAAEPAESTVRQWSAKIVEAHRRALGD